MKVKGPQTLQGSSVSIYLRVDDADEVMKKAVAGGSVVSPLNEEGHGDHLRFDTRQFVKRKM
jgi:uncharacterized glyoxalase superfamily protein PhnB